MKDMSEEKEQAMDGFDRMVNKIKSLESRLAEQEKRAFEYHTEWESACLRERGRIEDVKDLESRLKVCMKYRMDTLKKRFALRREVNDLEQRLSQAEAENVKLRDALRPFANMSECIENDKDFRIDGDCWIKAKEALRG